ncbi:MAG: hypothetical protein DMF89_19455 [Acidobacteria bacterium]|nr:MAG: hypothetical protein DMF89_19455 [Acidobacteriota bacterium]
MVAYASAKRVHWPTVMLVAAFLSADGLRVAGSGQGQGGDHETFPLTAPKRYVSDVAASEDMQSVVQKSLKSTFIAGIRSYDWERTARALSPDFRGRFPRPGDGHAVDDDLLRIRQYEPEALEVVDREGLVDTLRAHVGAWTSIERASLNTFEFLLEPNRDRAFAKVHFELGGPNPGGGRSVVNATIAVGVVRVAGGEWQIRRLDIVEAMRVDNPRPPMFRDITDAAGLHVDRSEADRQSRQEILDNRASLIDAAVSIIDWNHDGFWDILLTEGLNYSVLFLNDGKGGFVRGKLPVEDRRQLPSQFLFVDLDGDGLEELVSNRVSYLGNRAWMGIYTRRDGKWVFLPHALEFENPPGLIRSDAQSMTAGDVNGDGLIDLFVAGYDNNRSGDPARFNLVDGHDGDKNLLFMNHGGLRFTEESVARGITGTHYTYVAQFFDFDGDGDLDIFEGHDYSPNVIWENKGDGTFRALKDHPFARDVKFTMGLTIGDWNNTGKWSVYVSNMYSHAGNRVVRLADSVSEKTRALLKKAAQGNQLFTMKSGVWEDEALAQGVNDAGWAWGSAFVDIDNDGDKEIFVANGNTSHRDPEAPDF